MHKGILAYVIIIIVIIALWYFTSGLRFPKAISTTSISASTTIKPNTTNATTTSVSSTIIYLSNCANLGIFNKTSNTINSEYCSWSGGTLGIWVASGGSKSINFSISSFSTNTTYINRSTSYSCSTFFQNITLPAQIYKVTLQTGAPGGICNNSYSFVKFNTTTVAPKGVIYSSVYNGNFSTGEYNGWTINGTGFGKAPMNITEADLEGCYQTAPWLGYSGNFFATTFNCGLSNSPGNITSSPFMVNEPFLNFKIISPEDENLYVEVLYNNTPYAIAHYNTYNGSLYTGTAPYTFRNASIPLLTLANKPVQVRVVASTLKHHNYIAVTDFHLSKVPNESPGILVNLTTS